jgi:hypothetical protein
MKNIRDRLGSKESSEVLSSERAPHKKKKKRNCHTSNKYMATGPTGARCQE